MLNSATSQHISSIQNRREYESIISSPENKILVIDFQKSQCRPCQKVAPLFAELAEKYSGQGVVFYKADADTSPECKDLMKFVGELLTTSSKSIM